MMKKVLKMNHQPLDPIQLVGRMPNVINIIINDNKINNIIITVMTSSLAIALLI